MQATGETVLERPQGGLGYYSRLPAKEVEAGRRKLEQARSRTVWQAIADAAAIDPSRTALVGASDAGVVTRVTYQELTDRIRALSAGLAGIGVRRGDRVVLWMTTTVEWVVSAFAVMRLGATVVPVNTFLKPPEIKYFIGQSGARHLIMMDRFRKLNMPELLSEICPEVTAATERDMLFSPELPDLRSLVLWGRDGGSLACAHGWAGLAATATPELLGLADQMAARVRPDELAMVKYTSGSTAQPKGVMLEQGGIVANALLHTERMGARASDVYFSMMPFFHAGGSIYGLLAMLVNGGTLVFTEAFDPVLAADLVVAEQATILVTVLWEEIVQSALSRGMTFPSMRMAAVPNDDARMAMPNVDTAFLAYGLTETHGPACLSSYTPGVDDPAGSRLLDGNEGIIVDPQTGAEVGPGVPGELLLRGNIARGYWNKPVESAKAFNADGWFHTEDLCVMDEQGFIRWTGRLKLMLKVGGENVSIEEVEHVVTSHDCVLQCAAVGVADARKVEAVRVYAVLCEGRTIAAEDLRAWLSARLAHFKVPREILFVEALPRLANGKLNRLELSEWAKQPV